MRHFEFHANEGEAPHMRVVGRLSAGVTEQLLRALRDEFERVQSGETSDRRHTRDALGQALHRLSVEMRSDGLSAEHAVIALNGLLDSLEPEMRRLDASLETFGAARAFRGRVVTACIEAYYAHADKVDGANGERP
jgi:hypothetical protein